MNKPKMYSPEVREQAVRMVFDELAIPRSTTETVAGYKVSVEYNNPPPGETNTRLQSVRDIIARSLGRQAPP
jgi:hypothetical protein